MADCVKGQDKQTSATSSLLGFAIILFAVVAYFLTNVTHHGQSVGLQASTSSASPHHDDDDAARPRSQQRDGVQGVHNMNRNIKKKVEALQWEEGQNFFLGQKEINKHRKNPVPVILKNTLVKNWPALTHWKKQEYLIQHPVRPLSLKCMSI